jgi:hypothetical protein
MGAANIRPKPAASGSGYGPNAIENPLAFGAGSGSSKVIDHVDATFKLDTNPWKSDEKNVT